MPQLETYCMNCISQIKQQQSNCRICRVKNCSNAESICNDCNIGVRSQNKNLGANYSPTKKVIVSSNPQSTSLLVQSRRVLNCPNCRDLNAKIEPYMGASYTLSSTRGIYECSKCRYRGTTERFTNNDDSGLSIKGNVMSDSRDYSGYHN